MNVPNDFDNVIPMNPAIAKVLEITKKNARHEMACIGQHRSVEVDEKARTLTCVKCGYVVDPFEYVHQWAKDGQRRMEGLERIEIQRRVVTAEVESLQRQIESLRGKLKRAGAPQDPVERQHFAMLKINPHIAKKEFPA